MKPLQFKGEPVDGKIRSGEHCFKIMGFQYIYKFNATIKMLLPFNNQIRCSLRCGGSTSGGTIIMTTFGIAEATHALWYSASKASPKSHQCPLPGAGAEEDSLQHRAHLVCSGLSWIWDTIVWGLKSTRIQFESRKLSVSSKMEGKMLRRGGVPRC